MEDNRLLTPAKRKEVQDEIARHNLDLSDFSWEPHKSEEFLEKAETLRGQRIHSPQLRMELRYSYQIQYENSTKTVSKLVHKGSAAFITFDRVDDKWMSKFSLGQDYGTDKKIFDSSEDQIKFATGNWLYDLKQNLRAEGLITEEDNAQPTDLESEESHQTAGNHETELTDIEKGNALYQEIISKHPSTEKFTKSREGETAIKVDIKKIEDADKLLGNEQPEKRVELQHIKERLESQLPQTLDEVGRTISKNSSRWLRNKIGLEPVHFIYIVLAALAVVAFISFATNVFKIRDAVFGGQSSNFNHDAQISTPIQASPTPVANVSPLTINANISKKNNQEQVRVSSGQSAKAVDGKLIISVRGISYETNIGNALVHMVTGTIREIGKSSVDFVRKEPGYSTKIRIEQNDYEIYLLAADTFDATFLITRTE